MPATAGIWECAFFQIFSRETSSRASDLYGKRLHEMDQEERSQQVGPLATPHFDVKHLLGNAIFLISNCHLLGNEKSRRSKTGSDSFLMAINGCVVCGAGASGAEPGGAVHAKRGDNAGHDAHRPGTSNHVVTHL